MIEGHDNWCGYKGHYIRGSYEDFIKHLHICEKELADRIKNPKGDQNDNPRSEGSQV